MSEISYKDIIEQKGFYIATPIGTSMKPLLIARRDTVKLVRPDNINKYDVILYQRKDKTFVLHRVVGKNKKGFILCGDNQFIKEYNITDDMIIGKMEGYYKDEQYIPVTDKKYQRYAKKKVASIPFRHFIYRIKCLIKKIIRKK